MLSFARIVHRCSRTLPKVLTKGHFKTHPAYQFKENLKFSTCANKTLLFRAPTLPVCHEDEALSHLPDTITVTFVTKDGDRVEVKGREGERAMYLAHRKGIDMEGACEASLACTTW